MVGGARRVGATQASSSSTPALNETPPVAADGVNSDKEAAMSRTRKIAARTSHGTVGRLSHTSQQRRIYVACPKSEYHGARYDSMLRYVRQLYPDALILEPARLFDSLQDWRTRCLKVLQEISELVFFTTLDGWIGRGVYAEIQAAIGRRIPVWLLTTNGYLVPFARVSFADLDQENWTRYCRVCPRIEEQE
jgi:hypothetical protein